MRVSDELKCETFPCTDVARGTYRVPRTDLDPARVRVLMIAEAPPADPADGFDAGPDAFFFQTTAQAFADAGAKVGSLRDVLDLGVYLTTAAKCAKVGYALSPRTIQACSGLLAAEIALFPNVAAYLLMGDGAIKAFNQVVWSATGQRVIPGGSTYKIRAGTYSYQGARVFPSYLQTGKSYLIEKSKRQMIAEDIRAALAVGRAI